jgi:hypothetical protein
VRKKTQNLRDDDDDDDDDGAHIKNVVDARIE